LPLRLGSMLWSIFFGNCALWIILEFSKRCT
jgi:hypothetical protein